MAAVLGECHCQSPKTEQGRSHPARGGAAVEGGVGELGLPSSPADSQWARAVTPVGIRYPCCPGGGGVKR
jgi:hypothetical protein